MQHLRSSGWTRVQKPYKEIHNGKAKGWLRFKQYRRKDTGKDEHNVRLPLVRNIFPVTGPPHLVCLTCDV
jgi:hypothetical protein